MGVNAIETERADMCLAKMERFLGTSVAGTLRFPRETSRSGISAAGFGWPDGNPPKEVRVRWPDGRVSQHVVDPRRAAWVLSEPQR
jgi:hypothetical protein